MAFRFLRLLVGLALIPLCVAVALALIDLLRDLPLTPQIISPQTAALAGGYFLWLIIYLTMTRPMRAYIWAHELTHALWGLFFGARIMAPIRVKQTGGAVALSKTNTLIALAPYFFPFYTMIIIFIHWALGLWLDMRHWELVWLFLVGLTWGFHFTFTIQTLLIRQPDIVQNGRMFSLALICLLNLFGICIWVVCTTPATMTDLGQHLVARSANIYGYVWIGLCRFYQAARSAI